MGVPKRRATTRKKKAKFKVKASAKIIRGRANAGNVGYKSQLPNAGVVRVKVRPKR